MTILFLFGFSGSGASGTGFSAGLLGCVRELSSSSTDIMSILSVLFNGDDSEAAFCAGFSGSFPLRFFSISSISFLIAMFTS